MGEFRINIYKQIRAFYSIVFEQKYEIRPTHISLYMFFINQNNRSNWSEWFKSPFDTIMMGASINSNKTYYKVLNDLQDYGFINYKKGINNYKAPLINIIPLYKDNETDNIIPKPEESSSVLITRLTTLLNTLLSTQLTTQQTTQLTTQLSTQLSTHKDILITGNYKLIINKATEENKKFLYNKFYDHEIEKSENDNNYINFVKVLFGENNLKIKLDAVLRMSTQMTFEQFKKIMNLKQKNGFKITEMLEKMENWGDLKKRKTVYLTLLTFIKNSIK